MLEFVEEQVAELRGAVEEDGTLAACAQDDLRTPGWDSEPMAVLACWRRTSENVDWAQWYLAASLARTRRRWKASWACDG